MADIFLGEFMRIFNHFHSRNRSNALSDKEFQKQRFLANDDTWTRPHFKEGSQEQQERLLFRAKPPVAGKGG